MDRSTRREILGALAGSSAILAGCTGETHFDDTEPAPPEPPSNSTSDPVEPVEEGRYTEVIEQTIDSVTLLRAYDGESTQSSSAQGSAFVYDETHLVTNHHVVADRDTIDIRYTQNDWATGEVVGSDARSDLAAVRVDNRPPYATPLPLIDGRPAQGTEVLALGNPLGYESSVSAGMVGHVGRSIPASGDISLPNAVQTDAALNPGNSGGPLVNMDGEVLAVVSLGTGEGIGFGISSALVRRVIPELITTGEYRHAYMGIVLQDVTWRIAAENDLPIESYEARGVYVIEAQSGTPAEAVLRGSDSTQLSDGITVPVGGDVIYRLDDQPIDVTADLSRYLALQTSPGDTIDVHLWRDGESRVEQLTLGAREEYA